jgi:hypothetical protein
MEMSSDIGEITKALIEFRKVTDAPRKKSVNPHFKSKFADLEEVIDATQPALDACGLAVVQFPCSSAQGVGVETLVSHTSGQWMRGRYELPLAKSSPQDGGSAITYARRYALLAALGIAAEDDDAETAQGRGKSKPEAKPVRSLDDVAGKPVTTGKPTAYEPFRVERKEEPAKAGALLPPPYSCPVIDFGKHKGKPIAEVQAGYLRWMQEQPEYSRKPAEFRAWVDYVVTVHEKEKVAST